MLLAGTFLTLMVTYPVPTLLTSFLLIFGYFFLINRKNQPLLNAIFQRSERIKDEVDNDRVTLGKTQQDILDEDARFIPYKLPRQSLEDLKKNSGEFYELMNQRRSVRFFSKEPVPMEIIENVVKTAGKNF